MPWKVTWMWSGLALEIPIPKITEPTKSCILWVARPVPMTWRWRVLPSGSIINYIIPRRKRTIGLWACPCTWKLDSPMLWRLVGTSSTMIWLGSTVSNMFAWKYPIRTVLNLCRGSRKNRIMIQCRFRWLWRKVSGPRHHHLDIFLNPDTPLTLLSWLYNWVCLSYQCLC